MGVFVITVVTVDKYIEYFWNVLESFTQEERKRFLQFTYAQRRLPSNDEEWRTSRTAKLRIKMYRFPEPKAEPTRRRRGFSSRSLTKKVIMTKKLFQKKMDQQLPTAQTCFFDLYLPSYSSEKIMRERLLTAIRFESFVVEENMNDGKSTEEEEKEENEEKEETKASSETKKSSRTTKAKKKKGKRRR